MNNRRKLIVALAAVLSGCASSPEPHETQAAIGRVLSVELREIPYGRATTNVPVFGIGMVVVPMAVTSPSTYVYEIRLEEGRTIRTQSLLPIRAGECVRLWHRLGGGSTSDKDNFMPGTLESSTGCK